MILRAVPNGVFEVACLMNVHRLGNWIGPNGGSIYQDFLSDSWCSCLLFGIWGFLRTGIRKRSASWLALDFNGLYWFGSCWFLR